MKINWTIELSKAARDQGLRARSYSGRAMYGRTCLAICPEGSAYGLLAGLLRSIPDHFADDELADAIEEFATLLEGTKEDSMGRGVVVYWPSVAAPDPVEEEYDGDEDEEG